MIVRQKTPQVIPSQHHQFFVSKAKQKINYFYRTQVFRNQSKKPNDSQHL